MLSAAWMGVVVLAGLGDAQAADFDKAAVQAHLSASCAWPGEDPVPNRRLVKVMLPAAPAMGQAPINLLEIYKGSWVFRGEEVDGARGLAAALDKDEEAEAEKGVTLGSGAEEEGTVMVRIGGGVRGRTVARAARVLSARGLRDVTFVGQAYQVPLRPTLPPESPLRQAAAELASQPDDAARSKLLHDTLMAEAESACSGAIKEVDKMLVDGQHCAGLSKAFSEISLSCPSADLLPFASWAVAGTHPSALYTGWTVRLHKPPLNDRDVPARDVVLLGEDEPWTQGHVRVLAKADGKVHLKIAEEGEPLDGSKPKKKRR